MKITYPSNVIGITCFVNKIDIYIFDFFIDYSFKMKIK